MGNSIYHSSVIYNRLIRLNLGQIFSSTVMNHILSILISVFLRGYRGKTVDFACASPCHRTTIAHFLNHGKWEDAKLEMILKEAVVRTIYGESLRSGKPVFCIVDDTISSKTKPSSRALHPIEDAYFHQSHLKRRQDYGHQAVSIMLSCNGFVLNYAVIMYDKSKSKIKIVQEIAQELPAPPFPSFFLYDSWYTSADIIQAFIRKGFFTVGALKTNRILYPAGYKMQVSELASYMKESMPSIHTMTVGKRKYKVYRYEGPVNGVGKAVVLLSYPENAFGEPSALCAFLCMNCTLSIEEILTIYIERWSIEVFFRESKQKLGFDQYQIRSSQGIKRFWLLMSLAHFLCCTGTGKNGSFKEGYAFFQRQILIEKITYIYQCGAAQFPLNDVLALVG